MHAERPDIVDHLVAEQRPGFSLQQPFYCDPDIFTVDIERVVSKQWLLVDHVSRVSKPGDYFLFSIANEEIIVVRQDDDHVGAFFNVCRHRGSRVCLEPEGHKRLFTCPYHAWSYRLDGSLQAARLMPEDFDATRYGLHRCHVRVFHGFVFVNLSTDPPPDFDEPMSVFSPILRWHGFESAKIAEQRNYPSGANWKLLVENFLECYHCVTAHPELCQSRAPESLGAFGSGPGSGSEDSIRAFAAVLEEFETRVQELGHPDITFEELPGSAHLRQIGRAPIKPGSVTETKDGKPASRLMGQFNDYDGGITMLTFNPLSYVFASNDFAVMFRFTPIGPTHTDVELSWLVDAAAEEGVDYTVDNLTWTLDATLRQDKTIVQNNQRGIRSSRYRPGTYSQAEGMVIQFQDWYLGHLKKAHD